MCSSLRTLGLLHLQLNIEVVILQLLMLLLEVLHHCLLLLVLPLQGLQQAACHTQWSAAGPAALPVSTGCTPWHHISGRPQRQGVRVA